MANPRATDRDLLTTKELAGRLGRSPQTVRRLASEGVISAVRAGQKKLLFSWSAVQEELRNSERYARLLPRLAAQQPDDAPLADRPADDRDLLTTEELAGRLGLSEQTVRKMANDGSIPALKVGKEFVFSWKAVQEELRNSERDPDVQTTEELAGRLGLSEQTVRKMANDGTIPVLRAGRKFLFSWNAVQEKLRESSPSGGRRDPTQTKPNQPA